MTNIWYSKEELNDLLDLEQKLDVILKNKYQTVVNKNYFSKNYWLNLKKIREETRQKNKIADYLEAIRVIIEYLKKIEVKYQTLTDSDSFTKELSKEKYLWLYETYITVRNILANIPKELLIVDSLNIRTLIIRICDSINWQDLNENYNLDEKYYNNDWYNLIKDYHNIRQIYDDALTNSWSYETFLDISNAFKLFQKKRYEEQIKAKLQIKNANKSLEELPSYLVLNNPNLTSLFDVQTLKMIKKDLITRLADLNEGEQNQTINCLYHLTKKLK